MTLETLKYPKIVWKKKPLVLSGINNIAKLIQSENLSVVSERKSGLLVISKGNTTGVLALVCKEMGLKSRCNCKQDFAFSFGCTSLTDGTIYSAECKLKCCAINLIDTLDRKEISRHMEKLSNPG